MNIMVALYLNATCTSRGLQGNKFSTAAVAVVHNLAV
jgi:hypothetical protein